MKNGFMGFDLKDQTATIWDDGHGKFSCSHRRTIGATVAAILKQPAKSKNRYVYTSSFETSQKEILASLERNTGNRWKVVSVTSDQMIAEGREGLAKGHFISAGKLALAASYSGKYGGDFASMGKLANDEFGIHRESLDEIVSEILANTGSLS